MADLEITSQQVDQALVIRLAGEPHMKAGAPMQDLVATTVAAQPGKVVIDLSGLEYISSRRTTGGASDFP